MAEWPDGVDSIGLNGSRAATLTGQGSEVETYLRATASIVDNSEKIEGPMKDYIQTTGALPKACATPFTTSEDEFARAWNLPPTDSGPSPVRRQIIELLNLRRPKNIHHPES